MKVIDRVGIDIEKVDNRLQILDKSLSTLDLEDYKTITSIQNTINRSQAEKTSLLRLQHQVVQDIDLKNRKILIEIKKMEAEISSIENGAEGIEKLTELIASIGGIARGEYDE